MPDVYREVEMKFSVDDAAELPGLDELAGERDDGAPWLVGEPERQTLRATYVDTAELDLHRHGITLRRRVGGADAGWHLKVPGGEHERSEVRLPPGRTARVVPGALQRLVHARTQGRPLVPVAEITTRRTVHRLFDATDQALLELADDRVSARRILPAEGAGDAAGAPLTWCEVEVEVLAGDATLLDAVAGALRARGLTEAPHGSKVARVLDGGARPSDDGSRRGKRLRATSSSSSVALAYVTDQVEQIRVQDLRVRMDAPGSVHKMRVATRRLRSALATYRALFDRELVKPLRAELTWLAGVLGEVRDAEVMRERVRAVLEAEPADEASGADDADAPLRSAHDAARAALLVELDGERYDRLLDALESVVAAPPTTKRGDRPAAKVLRRGIAAEYDHVRRLMKRARTARRPERCAEALHDARKAAKRTRYAAELAAAVFGADARRFAAAMEDLQEVLGEHQDTVVLRARLRELARGTTDPVAAFAYGRLHALEEVRSRDVVARVPAVWAKARRKRLRRWLG